MATFQITRWSRFVLLTYRSWDGGQFVLEFILPFCHTAILSYCHSAILPYCHSAILPFCHSAILPYCHSAILPFCHSAVLPFCHSAILPFCHRYSLVPDPPSTLLHFVILSFYSRHDLLDLHFSFHQNLQIHYSLLQSFLTGIHFQATCFWCSAWCLHSLLTYYNTIYKQASATTPATC